MFRSSDSQGHLFTADKLYLKMVGEASFYAFLASQGARLFPDERFESWFCSDNGRPCVSPCMLTKVLLLQMHDRCSDAEAVERAKFDLRWKVALCLDVENPKPFAKSTLQQHRARIHLNEAAQLILAASIQEAKRTGVLKGSTIKVCLDTTPVFGRGAVKDTFNLVADGIKAVCRALAAICGERPESWAGRHDLARYFGASSLKGDANIDWTDDSERRVFLSALVADVDRVLLVAERALRALKHDNKHRMAVQKGTELLKQLVTQDVDRSKPDEPVIKQEVAKDRIVSVHDPEMRHGRKSASKRFDGHKLAVAVEPDSQIITAVAVKPGNASDASEAFDFVTATEQATGATVERTIGDCAYGDGATRQAFEDQNRTLVAKVPSPPKDQPFHKSHFQIDLVNNRVTCPAGQTTTEFDYVTPRGKDAIVKYFVFPAEVCGACPLAAQCVKNQKGAGRMITLHPQEQLLQEARAYQKSEQFVEDKRDRQAVEHRIARLVQLGVRQARYFGRAKTGLQCILAAAVANLTRVVRVTAAAAGAASFTLFLYALAVVHVASSPFKAHLASLRAKSRAVPPQVTRGGGGQARFSNVGFWPGF